MTQGIKKEESMETEMTRITDQKSKERLKLYRERLTGMGYREQTDNTEKEEGNGEEG